ncbi:hypothetical protein Bca101_066500 [Brassica carinata]
MSPYYVDPDFLDNYPDENLPVVILSIDDDNYIIWKNQFLRFLLSKNKTAFVDGTIVKPEPSSPLYEAWKACNARIYELRQRIAMLRQDGDSVQRYFEKLWSAWMELREYDPLPECSCGGCRCEIKKRVEEAREKEELRPSFKAHCLLA